MTRLPHAAPRGRSLLRRLAAGCLLLAALGLVGIVYAALAPSGQAGTPAGAPSASAIAAGRQLFLVSCATCHGLDAQGGSNAPSLIGVGAAAVDFQVGTGRMPAATHQDAEMERKLPRFDQTEINELAAYIQSLAPGPQIPTDLNYTKEGNIGVGGDIFRDDCAACHNAVGSGGELTYGKYAPALNAATAKQIYEAMLTGPENMPVFSDRQLTPQQKLSVIKYLLTVRNDANPGGDSLGRIGPISEGAVAWIVGLGVIIGITAWIGSRA
jgi:ubiquinol-cytochrome c reductase cytochrome c subunit